MMDDPTKDFTRKIMHEIFVCLNTKQKTSSVKNPEGKSLLRRPRRR
jgi:hypothetical protein